MGLVLTMYLNVKKFAKQYVLDDSNIVWYYTDIGKY